MADEINRALSAELQKFRESMQTIAGLDDDNDLNAAGLAWLKSKFGDVAVLARREGHDAEDILPDFAVNQRSGTFIRSSETAEATQKPKLVVVYIPKVLSMLSLLGVGHA